MYLGDHQTLRKLIPDPKAVIFVADYDGNMTALASYLKYLESNETAYEEHRDWRKTFSISKFHNEIELLRDSWECRICAWASKAALNAQQPKSYCAHHKTVLPPTPPPPALNVTALEGSAVKGTRRTVYLVVNGVLRPIPDFDTFTALNLDAAKIIQLGNEEIASIPMGESLPKKSP